MATIEQTTDSVDQAGQAAGEPAPAQGCEGGRAMRADARRNYEKVLNAAREAFAERGAETSLEGIARRAGVGIGTLYRHFPNRQALLEAVYVGEVEELCNRAEQLKDLPPWEAFSESMSGVVRYMGTKQALAQELLDYVGYDSHLFLSCRSTLSAAIQPLLTRAQEAKAVRQDTDYAEVIRLISGISKVQTNEPSEREHLLQIALDGLRYHD
jgi:AcrR family transcriptional regulator